MNKQLLIKSCLWIHRHMPDNFETEQVEVSLMKKGRQYNIEQLIVTFDYIHLPHFILQESIYPCTITKEPCCSREKRRRMTTLLSWHGTGSSYRFLLFFFLRCHCDALPNEVLYIFVSLGFMQFFALYFMYYIIKTFISFKYMQYIIFYILVFFFFFACSFCSLHAG